MQTNNKKKKNAKPQLVYKPFLRGVPVSAMAAKRGIKLLGYTALFTFLYVLVGSALSFENTLLRVALNTMLVLAAAALVYSDGARQGENDVTFAEIAQNRLDEGKTVPQSERAQCYHPAKGFFTALCGAAPIVLIMLVYALLAQKQTYTLGVLPSWVAAYDRQAEVGQALAYYNQHAGMGVADALRVAARLINFPFVNMVGAGNYDALYLIDKLSPLLCLITPLGYPLGYLRGPMMRAMVHGNIKENNRKQKRRVQKERKMRAQPKPEKKELI